MHRTERLRSPAMSYNWEGCSTTELAQECFAVGDDGGLYWDDPQTWQKATRRALKSLESRGLVKGYAHRKSPVESTDGTWDARRSARPTLFWRLTRAGEVYLRMNLRSHMLRKLEHWADRSAEELEQRVAEGGILADQCALVLRHRDGDDDVLDAVVDEALERTTVTPGEVPEWWFADWLDRPEARAETRAALGL
jgi:hypothetical protein